jgi:signal transduction histidine kinase
MAPKTLFGKLLLVLLGFGALMTGVFIFMMRVSHERYHLESEQLTHRGLAHQYVVANLLAPEPSLTTQNLPIALRRITTINPNVCVYVLDAKGNIVAASVARGEVVSRHVELEPITRFLSGAASFPLLGDDPSEPWHREVFSTAPLSIPGSPAAYLYVVLHRDGEGAAAGRLKATYAMGEDAGVIVAATLLAIGGSILFLRILTRRLGVLQRDIEHFRDGRFVTLPARQLPPDRRTDDEIERLRRLFIELAERIQEQMHELHKTDDLRRELLANVSHDLRTPLTTLQTHLEILSLKEDLSAEERQQYLVIALQQTRRLVTLVDRLLELAKLDAGQVAFAPEPFQLSELVQDIVLKSALQARRADVALSMTPPAEDIPLVMGDIALVERVLDCVLENALRHAHAGGAVTVSVKAHPQGVRVSVHDTGGGIPESERTRIFESFYRGDKSRSSASGQAGLGLSIARGILQLHGTSIDFVSSPTQGTLFFFELPIASPVGGAAALPGRYPTGVRAATTP